MISLLALKQLLEQFMMMLFIPKGVMIYYIYSQRSDGVYKNFRGKHYNEKEVELAKKVFRTFAYSSVSIEVKTILTRLSRRLV